MPEQAIIDIRKDIEQLTERVRTAVQQTENPRAEALLETTAEVLIGLDKAYEHFAGRSEEAWR